MNPTSSDDRKPGMGAIPYDGGVAFRVWAPHADSVAVRGTFDDWTETGEPLVREESGYWYGDVRGAVVGDQYQFRITNAGAILDRIDPYAREVTNSVGNGVVVSLEFDWGEDDYSFPPWNEAVIYEMHIGTFSRTDDDEVGTFADALHRLDHLKRLGVNVLQLMPTSEFAGDLSWGYNPAHIFAIESAYGGPTAFKRFVRAAHREGFAVILDVVYNHFGPSDLDLWQFDGWHQDGMGGIYFYNDWRAETPWGATRPDYGRTEVRQMIRDNAISWLDEYHVDGLRWDMTLFIRSVRGDGAASNLDDGWRLMRDLNQEIAARFPGALIIAEDLQNDPAIVSPEGAGFGSQWDAAFVHPVRAVVTTPRDEERSVAAIRYALEHCYRDDAFARVVYSESHDEVANGKARVPEEISPGDPGGWAAQKRSTLAAALVMTSPGIPMIFQGQEFLQGEWFRDEVPLDWDLSEEYHGILRMYRDLIRLRRNFRDQTRGLTGHHLNTHHVNEGGNVLAFHRWAESGEGDDVVVIVNLSHTRLDDYRVGFPAEGLWRLRLNSDWAGYSDDFHNTPGFDLVAEDFSYDGLANSATLTVGPYTVLIYSQGAE